MCVEAAEAAMRVIVPEEVAARKQVAVRLAAVEFARPR